MIKFPLPIPARNGDNKNRIPWWILQDEAQKRSGRWRDENKLAFSFNKHADIYHKSSFSTETRIYIYMIYTKHIQEDINR